MGNFIRGEDVLRDYDLQPFELATLVKLGQLDAYDDAGRRIFDNSQCQECPAFGSLNEARQWMIQEWQRRPGLSPYLAPGSDPAMEERVARRLLREQKSYAHPKGSCWDFTPSRDKDILLNQVRMLQRMLFQRAQVEAALKKNGKGQDTDPANISQPTPQGTQAETPAELIARLQTEGVLDNRKLAAAVDKAFPGQIPDARLGELLPASPGRPVSWAARNSQGRRLRGKKK